MWLPTKQTNFDAYFIVKAKLDELSKKVIAEIRDTVTYICKVLPLTMKLHGTPADEWLIWFDENKIYVDYVGSEAKEYIDAVTNTWFPVSILTVDGLIAYITKRHPAELKAREKEISE